MTGFASLAFSAPTRRGPALDQAAYVGFTGHYVQALEQTTEADPAAILATTLSLFGAYVGPGPHVQIGDDRHPMLLNVLVIGHTSTARKGTSYGVVRRVFKQADPIFMAENVVSGLSSGEGLVHAVRDPDERDDDDKRPRDPGVSDKRLYVIETEFAVTMGRGKREGNSLPGVLRQAWDGSDLRVLTKSPVKATGPHIAITAHVTPKEFRTRVLDSEMAGGTYNRFLPVWSERARLLPEGGGADENTVGDLAVRLRRAASAARQRGRMELDNSARQLWIDEVYPALNPHSGEDGPVIQFTARATAQCMRVAMGYALLDSSPVITTAHLTAAHAVVAYAEGTARHIFGDSTGSSRLDQLLAAIRDAGSRGLTRTEISRKFSGHIPGPELDNLLEHVAAHPDFAEEVRRTGGRPVSVYRISGEGETSEQRQAS